MNLRRLRPRSRRSRRHLLPTEIEKNQPSPRIGIVSAYTSRKGICWHTRALEDVISPSVSIFPAPKLRHLDESFRTTRATRVEPELRHEAVARPGTAFLDWLGQQQIVIFMERIAPRLFQYCQHQNIRTVLVSYIDYLPEEPQALHNSLRNVDRIVVHGSVNAAQRLAEKSARRIAQIPAGLHWPIEKAKRTSTKILFYFNIGVCGHGNRRNVPLVLRTFEALLSQYPNARLRIKILPQARKYHPELGSVRNAQIDVIEKNLPRNEMINLQREADVTLFPSRFEGLGLPLLESLYLGVPVIATDAPPMNEFINDGKNGLLVRSRPVGTHGIQSVHDLDEAHFRQQVESILKPGGCKTIDRLKEGAHRSIGKQQTAFRAGWQTLIEEIAPTLINLGAGDDFRHGMLNVDIRPTSGIDIVSDARSLPFENGMIDELLANDLLEHFPTKETGKLLDEWIRVLRPGGKLRIQTPDLHALCQDYLRGKLSTKTTVHWLYGAQDHPFNFHMTSMDEATLRQMLSNRGIHDIQRIYEQVSKKNICLTGRKQCSATASEH